MQDHCTGAHRRPGADCDTRKNLSTKSDVAKGADANPSPRGCVRCDVREIADRYVMLNNSRRINYGTSTHLRTCVTALANTTAPSPITVEEAIVASG